MKRIFRNKLQKQDPELADIEALLEDTLKPVKPRPAYVSGLKARLLSAQAIKAASPDLPKYTLWGLAGLASIAVIIFTGVRATIVLLTALGVLHYAQERVRNKQAQPVHVGP